MNLSEKLLQYEEEGRVGIYVVSRKPQENMDSGEKDAVPHFLKIEKNENGEIKLSGWNLGDRIPVEAKVVFAVAK